MGAHSHKEFKLDETFEFSAEARKKLTYAIIAGVVLFGLGAYLHYAGMSHGHGDTHGVHGENAGHHVAWTARLFAVIWHNSVFFTGISLVGVFFIAFNYVAWAGWSAIIKRIPESFGNFLPFTFAVMLITFIFGHHDLFHWTHHDLYDPQSEHYDKVLDGKKGYLNIPFYIARMVIFFGLWFFLFRILRKYSLSEDQIGGKDFYNKSINISAVFLLSFGVGTSMGAWDWVMSIDPHWYSTLFGWYNFASYFVAGLATITLTILLLKDKGYLTNVTSNHLHDLGKFMFAFSVFWTYLWTSQFLLIFYANIPEEIIYFRERMYGYDGHYAGLFFFNIFINFLFPFLVLMTRDAKRQPIFLKIVCIAIIVGHWLDFYLMIMPGVTKGTSGFGFMEIGAVLVFMSGFIWVISSSLTKANLVAKNHPLLQESLHHDI